MAQLPGFDPAEVATKTDLAVVKSDVAGLRADLGDLRTEVREGSAAVNQRLDRLFLTLLVGMFGVMTALIGVIFRIG